MNMTINMDVTITLTIIMTKTMILYKDMTITIIKITSMPMIITIDFV